MAAKVLGSKHAIIFAATYRPPRSDQTYMDTVNQNLSTLCHKFSNMPIWIGGDMNLPDIEWETEQLTTNQYTQSISYSFLDTLANTGLQQIVNFPTRNNNTLDVVLTNRPSLAKQCVGMPGLSDHDIVFVETSSRALRHKPARRKILLWKHAKFDDIHLKISNCQEISFPQIPPSLQLKVSRPSSLTVCQKLCWTTFLQSFRPKGKSSAGLPP